MPHEGLCFTIPHGWAFETVDAPRTNGGENALLHNASGALVYAITSGIGGLGFMCEDQDKAQQTVLTAVPTQLTATDVVGTARPVFVSQAVVTSKTGYEGRVFLTTDKQFATPGQKQWCGLGISNLISGKLQTHLGTDVGFEFSGLPQLDTLHKSYPTAAEAQAALTGSADTATIEAILKTAHYK